MTSEADYRLPRTVVPSHYDIEIAPDLAAASFAGTVTIDATVVEPTATIVLNAIELEIDGDQVLVPHVTLESATERAILTLDADLQPGDITLSLSFHGVLNDDLRGFYRSTYDDPDGNEHVIATTQFESTDARRAFPCWDEPDLKATFAVALIVDHGLAAFSNAMEVSREPAGDGKDRVQFATTMVMSTYLVALIVGEFEATEPVDVNGVPLRVITPPGKLHLASEAVEVGAFMLDFFASYYEVPYPGDKLDMVAIPDFGFGAMENLGCITYRETALLVDLETATQAELARVVSVIAHEIAHMWFGDLVTMKWWNGVWLNEAFATFAEVTATNAYRPEWNYWLDFANDRATSQETDALKTTRPIEFPVGSPAEADAMFDVLTYEKGASVLRQIELYLGGDVFRRGVSLYLKRHAYGNTDNEDLWAALEEVSGEPVGEIMDTWIFQGGYPMIDVTTTERGVRLSQRQFRFFGGGDASWKVPVLYSSSLGEGRVLVGEEPVEIEVGDDLIVNAGGEGFYRVAYDHERLASIESRLPELADIERYSVVSDLLAEMLCGRASAGDYFDLIRSLDDEGEADIWRVALEGLSELDRIVSSDDRDPLRRFVVDHTAKKADQLGWVPADGEDANDRTLRGLILKARGINGRDQETIRTAATQLDAADAEVADAALAIVAANGGLEDFERFVELSKGAPTPQLTVKYLRAATQVPHPDVPGRIIDMVLSGDIRTQDSYWVVALLIGHRDNGVRAWKLITERWEEIIAALAPNHRYRILDQLKFRSEPDVAQSVHEWFETHTFPGMEKKISQKLEMLDVRVGLREREGNRIGDALR